MVAIIALIISIPFTGVLVMVVIEKLDEWMEGRE